MRITINKTLLELHNGARVRDAVLKYYSHLGKSKPGRMPQVEDRFGNIVSVDGELTDGNTLFIRIRNRKSVLLQKMVRKPF